MNSSWVVMAMTRQDEIRIRNEAHLDQDLVEVTRAIVRWV